MASHDVAPAPPGFNISPFALSSPETGSSACNPVIDGAGTISGWPYDNSGLGTDEHGTNAGNGCPDKLQSYVDFRTNAVAPACFAECPDQNADVCAKAVWQTAEDFLLVQFSAFSTAYQDYDTAHQESATANSTFAQDVVDKNAAAQTLTAVLVDLLGAPESEGSDIYDESDDDYPGLNDSNAKVAAVIAADSALSAALQDLQASKDDKISKNKAFREKLFSLDMQLLKTRDALYREAWSRDHACSIKTNNDKWRLKYQDAADEYEAEAQKWQANQDEQHTNATSDIDAQIKKHNDDLLATEDQQQKARNDFYTDFTKALEDEDVARTNKLNQRQTEFARMLIQAHLLVYFRELFADNTEALHAIDHSAEYRRRQLAGSSPEQRAIEAEVKERVRVSLIKTLKIDDENAVRVTGISVVPGRASTYDVAYEVSCASDAEVKRLIPAISGSGKALFHKAMQGQMQVEIASASRTAMGAGTSVGGISSTSAQVRQRSSASSSGSMTISAAAGKFGEHAGSLLLSMMAPIVVSIALMALRR